MTPRNFDSLENSARLDFRVQDRFLQIIAGSEDCDTDGKRYGSIFRAIALGTRKNCLRRRSRRRWRSRIAYKVTCSANAMSRELVCLAPRARQERPNWPTENRISGTKQNSICASSGNVDGKKLSMLPQWESIFTMTVLVLFSQLEVSNLEEQVVNGCGTKGSRTQGSVVCARRNGAFDLAA